MMNKVKFQFEMPQANADRLEQLARESGVTKKDIINNAMTLLEWAIDEVKAGRTIASIDAQENRYKELVLPLLRDFAAQANVKATTTQG